MDNVLTVLTPYFPSQYNKYGGIFIYDQVIEMSKYFDKIRIFINRPMFYISKKYPYIYLNRKNSQFIHPKDKNIEIYEIKYIPFPKDTVCYHKSLQLSLFLYKFLFSKTILVHTIYPLGVAAIELNLTDTVVIHGSDLRYFIKNNLQKKAILKNLQKVKNIVVVSEGLKKDLLKLEIEESKIKVIHNGINIKDNIIDKKNYEKKDKFKFVFVGSIIKEKGVYELLEAFKQLNKKYKNIELYFIGEGIEKNNLIKNADKNIFFLGALSNKEVMEKLKNMDCLVLPSYKEGFGRVIIEMMSLGKPVISTYSGGPEFIINKDTGILVEPKNIEQLTEAMEKVMHNYEHYISLRIFEYVKNNFSLKDQTKKLIDLII